MYVSDPLPLARYRNPHRYISDMLFQSRAYNGLSRIPDISNYGKLSFTSSRQRYSTVELSLKLIDLTLAFNNWQSERKRETNTRHATEDDAMFVLGNCVASVSVGLGSQTSKIPFLSLSLLLNPTKTLATQASRLLFNVPFPAACLLFVNISWQFKETWLINSSR